MTIVQTLLYRNSSSVKISISQHQFNWTETSRPMFIYRRCGVANIFFPKHWPDRVVTVFTKSGGFLCLHPDIINCARFFRINGVPFNDGNVSIMFVRMFLIFSMYSEFIDMVSEGPA